MTRYYKYKKETDSSWYLGQVYAVEDGSSAPFAGGGYPNQKRWDECYKSQYFTEVSKQDWEQQEHISCIIENPQLF